MDFRKGKDTTLLDIEKLKKQFENTDTYEDGDGNKIKTIYLGSILHITPSRKVYTPFAHSNLKPCNKCKGEEFVKNKYGKKKKHKKILKKIMEIWPTTENVNLVTKLQKQRDRWEPMVVCTECNGLGSLEARLDKDFWEKLQSELDEIGAWYHGSDGDGCDVMVSIGVD